MLLCGALPARAAAGGEGVPGGSALLVVATHEKPVPQKTISGSLLAARIERLGQARPGDRDLDLGALGATQAAEALKLVIGCGEPLAGRLLLLDGLAMDWRSITVPRDPGCPVCGQR